MIEYQAIIIGPCARVRRSREGKFADLIECDEHRLGCPRMPMAGLSRGRAQFPVQCRSPSACTRN